MRTNRPLKRYGITHNGLAFVENIYGTSKRDAISRYREQWDLQGKRICLQIWEDPEPCSWIDSARDAMNPNYEHM